MAELARLLAKCAALGVAGLDVATRESLAGRWIPLEPFSTDPHVEVSVDGTWIGSDGCNGGSGRWAMGDGGELLVTAGPSTLIGCEGVGVPGLFAQSALAGFDGAELVLLDQTGAELVKLVRG